VSWCVFALRQHTGTVGKLLKIPQITDEVADRFERTKLSLLRAENISGVATHPKTGRNFYVVPFKCFLEPAPPLPDPVFKKHLAFSAQVVRPKAS
jgi:hypothetical protein